MFVSFAEPPAKNQPDNSVDKFSLDVRDDLRRWDLVVCLYVEFGKLVIDLGRL